MLVYRRRSRWVSVNIIIRVLIFDRCSNNGNIGHVVLSQKTAMDWFSHTLCVVVLQLV